MDEAARDYQRDWGGNTSALGGYGSGGLLSRRRQMERTVGGSFENVSKITSSNSRLTSRPIMSVGQGLSTSGPTPTGGPPEEAQRIGPSGPTKLAPGVKGNFERKSPHLYDIPRWGETFGKVVKHIGGASVAAGSLAAQAVGAAVERNPGGRLAKTAVGAYFGSRSKSRPTISMDEINPDFL